MKERKKLTEGPEGPGIPTTFTTQEKLSSLNELLRLLSSHN